MFIFLVTSYFVQIVISVCVVFLSPLYLLKTYLNISADNNFCQVGCLCWHCKLYISRWVVLFKCEIIKCAWFAVFQFPDNFTIIIDGLFILLLSYVSLDQMSRTILYVIPSVDLVQTHVDGEIGDLEGLTCPSQRQLNCQFDAIRG